MKKTIITSLIIMMTAYNANAATTPKDTASPEMSFMFIFMGGLGIYFWFKYLR